MSLSISIQFIPFLFVFIQVYPGLSSFINVYPALSSFINAYPCLSIFINVYPPKIIFESKPLPSNHTVDPPNVNHYVLGGYIQLGCNQGLSYPLYCGCTDTTIHHQVVGIGAPNTFESMELGILHHATSCFCIRVCLPHKHAQILRFQYGALGCVYTNALCRCICICALWIPMRVHYGRCFLDGHH